MMIAARRVISDTERRFPARIRVGVPPRGLGESPRSDTDMAQFELRRRWLGDDPIRDARRTERRLLIAAVLRDRKFARPSAGGNWIRTIGSARDRLRFRRSGRSERGSRHQPPAARSNATSMEQRNLIWIVADGRQLPFHDAVFDAVLCHSLLETVDNPGSVSFVV
jgi:hypothetical protein